MNKVCKYLKQIILVSLMLSGVVLNAQEVKLLRAQTLYNEKKPDLAKLCIDSVVAHPETSKRYESWTLRGFIYFEIYKKTNIININSPLRDSILLSIKRSNALNPDEDYRTNNNNLLSKIASNYHKIAKTYLLDSSNSEVGYMAYNKYKEIYKLVDPKFNFTERDLEYNLAVGSLFSDKFNLNKSDTKSFEIAKVALLKVLEVNPVDTSANINMGVMYLNQATDLVEKLFAGEVSIQEVDVIQDNAIKLAKQAEQFFLKVYNQNNRNQKAVLALYYVYRVLLDEQKQKEFELKCKQLKIEVSNKSSNTPK